VAATVDALRALGNRRVVVSTAEGAFAGRLVTDVLSDGALVVLLERDGAPPGEPLVIPLDQIVGVSPAP
jgi:hypothetical protein